MLVGALLLPAVALGGRAISVGGCQELLCAGVSADGSRVVFPLEEELTAGAGKRQIYEWARDGVRPLLPPSNGYWPQLSGVSTDATHVFVTTGLSLAPEDSDGSGIDIYDVSAGRATLISTGPLDGPASGAFMSFMGASPDGARVFFDAFTALTADDLDKCPDLYQRFAGATTLVGPNPAPPPYPICESAAFGGVSGDGSHVFFVSGVKLEPGDERRDDIYQQVGTTLTRLTTYPEPEGTCVELLRFAAASNDGGTVLFTTNSAISPEDANGAVDVYKRRPDGTFALVSRGAPDGSSCGFGNVRAVALSADGHAAIFETSAQLSPADRDAFNDLYRADDSGAMELISTGPTDPAVEEPSNVYPDWIADVSDDARTVAFETRQRLVKADRDESADVYARVDGRTTLISAGSPGEPPAKPNAELSGISADGSTVVYATREALVAKDTNHERDVYLRRLGSRHPVLLSAETIPPHMRIARRGRLLPSGALKLTLTCPKTETTGPCHGKLTLSTGRHGKPLGSTSFRIAPGDHERIEAHLRRQPSRRTLLARVRAADSLGNAATTTRRISLSR